MRAFGTCSPTSTLPSRQSEAPRRRAMRSPAFTRILRLSTPLGLKATCERGFPRGANSSPSRTGCLGPRRLFAGDRGGLAQIQTDSGLFQRCLVRRRGGRGGATYGVVQVFHPDADGARGVYG